MISYSVSMGLRMVCFVLAGVVAMVWESWWAWVFVLGAVVLPYTAVVSANAGADRYDRRAAAVDPRQLSTGHEQAAESRQWWEDEDDDAAAEPPQSDTDSVIPGELAEEALTDQENEDNPRYRSHR